ncbi:MAG TPA: DUF2079 domain-containing protein, partial [Actinomycetes bacterium]|nr:DUF2079 domain-containing protein [Actinomycetes bacterium]
MILLAVLIGAYVVVFGTLTWAQQSNFGTFGFDMGIYDQGIWLLSRFKTPFVTVRGLNYFANHLSLITVAFVPFYWLGAGPHFLYLVETVWMALGAVPLWLLARDRLANRWLPLGLVVSYLLYPALEWINWWHFHPDALTITPLLFAWWLASRRQWRWFAVAVAVALLCKEDVPLAVAALGLALMLRGQRRAGALTSVAGVAWFLLAVKVIIPEANGGSSPFYVQELFQGFGDSLGGILGNLITHPGRVLDLATQPDRLTYYRELLAPLAFLPLAAFDALLVALPQVAVNVLSSHALTHDIRYQYSSIVLAGMFLAAVESCARLSGRVGMRRFLIGLVAAASLAANVAWSPSPISVKYHSGIWATAQPEHAAAERALELVPSGAGVSATYYLVPHLTHRTHIYEFPNPWVMSYWGVRGSKPPDPATVDFLVVDRTLNPRYQPLFDRLVGAGGQFRII